MAEGPPGPGPSGPVMGTGMGKPAPGTGCPGPGTGCPGPGTGRPAPGAGGLSCAGSWGMRDPSRCRPWPSLIILPPLTADSVRAPEDGTDLLESRVVGDDFHGRAAGRVYRLIDASDDA